MCLLQLAVNIQTPDWTEAVRCMLQPGCVSPDARWCFQEGQCGVNRPDGGGCAGLGERLSHGS